MYYHHINFCACVCVGIKRLVASAPFPQGKTHTFVASVIVMYDSMAAKGAAKKLVPGPSPVLLLLQRPRTKLENAQHRCSTGCPANPGKLNGKENKVT